MRISRACLLLVVSLSVPAAVRAVAPQAFEADYVIESHGVTVGETRWKLEPLDNGFVWESSTSAVGMAMLFGENRVIERSEWLLEAGTMLPSVYRYERSGSRDKTVEITFDWQAGVVSNTADDRTWRMAVPAGTLDKLGYLVALMDDLRNGKRRVRYDIADGGRLKEYRLHVAGTDDLETAIGRVHTYRIVRERPDSDRETILWMAPELGFIPVRIERRDADGDAVTMSIRSLRVGVR